jgi:tetratricopeptide (TPR) repeat protein
MDWFQALLRLPPEPSVTIPSPAAVREVFAQVGFHPLSINVLTAALKQRRIADVAEALRTQLASNDDPLLASLNLPLERLAPEVKAALPGLSVFRDGVWEPVAAQVLELDEASLPRLRDGLRQVGLVVMETIPGISAPFLRFHPTLAPAMRARLSADDLARLGRRYQAEYYQLSAELYQMDRKHPEAACSIASRELPNLLAAAFAAIEQPDDIAADFANKVGWFLGVVGQTRDRAALQARVAAVVGQLGSDSWYLTESDRGEQLYQQGHFGTAAAVFNAILEHMGNPPSYRRTLTLLRLARCKRSQGQSPSAEAGLRQALAEVATFPISPDVRIVEGPIHVELGIALQDRGDLDGAKAEYEASVAIKEEIGDDRGLRLVTVNSGQSTYCSATIPMLSRITRPPSPRFTG